MRLPTDKLLPRATWRLVVPGLALAVAVAVAIIAGCAANEPFEPSTVPNTPPTARIFVGPVTPGGELNPTSYYRRTFRWSGTDVDGWVREYYVSVRTQADVPADWATTTGTDTTMTFTPDAEGRASATLLVACRDDRGAVSDTVVQTIPLRNFPPTVNFQSDFDPLRNFQREFLDVNGNVTQNPAAAADTNYFNWGPMNFRLFAMDLDGSETMDDFYRYTFADGDGLVTREVDDPAADPNTGWVRVYFNSSAEIKQFEITQEDIPPGPQRTLRVSLRDQAQSDADFRYTWEVREPAGPVLFIAEGLSANQRTYYENLLTARYGSGNWDRYNFWITNAPDTPTLLLQTFRKFQAVFWVDGGAGGPNLARHSALNGVINQYLWPIDGSTPGGMLYVSKGLVGQTGGLTTAFLRAVLGISQSMFNNRALNLPADKLALPDGGAVGQMRVAVTTNSAGVGITQLAGYDTEALYHLESCTCYYPGTTEYAPVVGIRVPSRTTDARARFVGLGLRLDVFDLADVTAAVAAILDTELGVTAP
ncbi:MAG: hypothetical protein IPK64_04355 [bacterium]|nr:hypothetical protein [bacterium]